LEREEASSVVRETGGTTDSFLQSCYFSAKTLKVRTKLILLLSAALFVTMAVSTYLRIRWTRIRLETQLRESAKDTAEAIAADLTKRLTADKDGDEVADELAKVKLRHPVVADLQLTLDTDEDTTSTFSLPANTDEPQVAQRPRSARLRPLPQRRDDARRALWDHGESWRRPGSRAVEPMWRTPDRPDPSRWPHAIEPQPQPRVARTFREGERGRQPVYEVQIAVDPDGPRHGQLTIAVTREPIERIVRTEQISSMLITGGAVLLLMMITALIVNQVVAKPVTELELAMKRIEGGQLDQRVEARSSDEIGNLSRGFNEMVDRLSQADGEIRAFNRRLADEVQAATTDLARKNATLGHLNRLLFEARRELGDKERLAALGQLAAQLAHEIGTPLASVSGHLQLAMTARDLPVPLKERLQVGMREVERVSKIVRDYLDSTRQVAPERAPVDVSRVVEEAVGIVQGDEKRAQVKVTTSVDAAAVQVNTDPGLLRQILVNLLTNAADAVLQSSGRGRIEVIGRATESAVQLAVRDDGVGIAPDDAARIFEPFYTTKGRGKGTGLGLAICRELALALGGRISVESAPGKGSTFTVTLPREAAQRAS
jgi:signal transduction histidine kinase